MGRAILIVVLLVSTIYAGIIVNVQKEMYKLPGVIVDNFITKEIENVSDYALRAAVRLGTENFILATGVDTMTVLFDGIQHPVYMQGSNSRINKIFYRRMNADQYEAVTYLTGNLQGHSINYTAQIAYDYPGAPGTGPLVLYNDYGQQTHAPDVLPDQSAHPSGIPMDGYVVAVGTAFSNVVKYSPLGLDKYFAGGGGTHKCLQFGAARINGLDHIGGWVQVPNPTSDSTTLNTLMNRLKNYNDFTVAVYAQPEKVKNSAANSVNEGQPYFVSNKGNVGTLYWAATDPYNAKFGQSAYDKPAAAIWYDNYNSTNNTVTMHYEVTIDNGTASGTLLSIERPGCPIYSNLGADKWHMYTLVFNNGTLSAYYDTQLYQSKTAAGGYTSIKPNDYGFTLGMRDIRADGLCPTQAKHSGTNYMFYNGLLDQITFWDSALSAQEVENWFNNYVDRQVKHYIRD